MSDLQSIEAFETTYLDRLACHRIHRTSCSYLEFIQHHVSQSLVVNHAKVDVSRELLSCDAGVHWLVAVVVVTSCHKLVAEVVNRSVLFSEPG